MTSPHSTISESSASSVKSLPTLNSSNTINLIKLSKDNYPMWRAQILPYLKGQRVFGYVDGTIPKPPQFIAVGDKQELNPNYEIWEQQDQLILSLINTSLTRDVFLQVYQCQTSASIWKNIHQLFAAQSQARIWHIRSQLASASQDNKSISEYYTQIKQLCDDLQLAGKPLSDEEVITHIITGLHKDYNHTADLIAEKGVVTLSEVYSMLMNAEARNHRQSGGSTVLPPSMVTPQPLLPTPAANYASNSSNYNRARNNSAYRGKPDRQSQYQQSPMAGQHQQQFNQPQQQRYTQPPPSQGQPRPKQQRYPPGQVPTCQVCFKVGHMAIECWHRFNQEYQPGSSQPHTSRAPQALNVQAAHTTPSGWVPDTGATHHMAQDFRNLSVQSEPYDGPEKVNIGDGSGLFGNNSS